MQNKPYSLIDKGLSEIKENILATLAYFDLFNYPLTRGEIYLFLKNKYPGDLFDTAIGGLLQAGIIYQFDKFYTLKNDHYLIVRRLEGNKKAAELIRIAERVGKMLIRFPFVRGVAISGSLSKNFADEFADIDLFIIAAKNRLWIARTIMHCFKKLTFLVKREHYFCMNYYIDMQQLEIAEKNIYTAIEICTLIPLQGDIEFEKFYAANAWTRDYLPNKIMRVSSAKPVKKSAFKNVFEYVFNSGIGSAIDNLLMKVTSGRWAKKTEQKKVNSHGAVMAIKTGKHFAKPDPGNFQSRLLARHENRVAQLVRQYEDTMAH